MICEYEENKHYSKKTLNLAGILCSVWPMNMQFYYKINKRGSLLAFTSTLMMHSYTNQIYQHYVKWKIRLCKKKKKKPHKTWMKDNFLLLNADFGPKSALDKVADFTLKHVIAVLRNQKTTVKDNGVFCTVYHFILISKTTQPFKKQSRNRTCAKLVVHLYPFIL